MAEIAIIDKSEVKAARHIGAFETFNGLIYDLRQQGYTLEEIGREIGRTRERVRQILVEHYGGTEIKWGKLVTTSQLIAQADCRLRLIEKLRRAGLITPVGRGIWDYDATLPVIIDSKPACKVCGKAVSYHRSHYCSDECYNKVWRHRYKNAPPEVKARHKQRVRKWMQMNPEQHRKIQRRATLKYRRKRKEEQYQFLVRRFTKIIPVKLKEI